MHEPSAGTVAWGVSVCEPAHDAWMPGIVVWQEDGVTDRDDAGMRMADDVMSDGHPQVPAGSRKRKWVNRLSDLCAAIVSLWEWPYCIRRDDDAWQSRVSVHYPEMILKVCVCLLVWGECGNECLG